MDTEHGMAVGKKVKISLVIITVDFESIKITYVLFFRRNTQNKPDKKKINDIMK